MPSVRPCGSSLEATRPRGGRECGATARREEKADADTEGRIRIICTKINTDMMQRSFLNKK